MKRVACLILVVVAVGALGFFWRDAGKGSTETPNSFGQMEVGLQDALTRLSNASSTDRGAARDVMVFADALAEVGDARQKRVAGAAKKEVGRVLFGEESSTGATSDSASDEVVLFPGPLPEQRFTPLPLQSYVGTYAGTFAGRAVNFIVKVTKRDLLGVRIVGLDVQPTMEFAETQPQEFFRPDNKTVVIFADATSHGFRTLYLLQNGVQERAENVSFLAAYSK